MQPGKLSKIGRRLTLLLNKNKRVITYAFTVVITIMLAAYIYNNRLDLLTFDWSISLGLLAIAIISYLVGLWSIFVAWLLIMKKLGSTDNFINHLSVFSKSILARRIPLPIWYIGSRFYYYDGNYTYKKSIAVGTYFETFLTGFSGVLLLTVTMLFLLNTIYAWLICIVIILIWLIMFRSPKLLIGAMNWILNKIHKQPIELIVSQSDWLKWMVLYILGWVCAGVSFSFCVYGITPIRGELITLISVATSSGLIGFFSMLLPAGFGLKEIGTGLLLGHYFQFSIGLVVALTYRLTTTFVELFWAIISGIFASRLTHKDY